MNIKAVTHSTTNILKDWLTSFSKTQSSTTELNNDNACMNEIVHDNSFKVNIKTNNFCERLGCHPSKY